MENLDINTKKIINMFNNMSCDLNNISLFFKENNTTILNYYRLVLKSVLEQDQKIFFTGLFNNMSMSKKNIICERIFHIIAKFVEHCFSIKQQCENTTFTIERILDIVQSFSLCHFIKFLWTNDFTYSRFLSYFFLLYLSLDDVLDSTLINQKEKSNVMKKILVWCKDNSDVSFDKPTNIHENVIKTILFHLEKEFPKKQYKLFYIESFKNVIETLQAQKIQSNQCSINDIYNYTVRKAMQSGRVALLSMDYIENIPSKRVFLMDILCFMMQLIDDLEDIDDDLNNGSNTLFVYYIKKYGNIDELVEKVINYIFYCSTQMKEIMEKSEKHTDQFIQDILYCFRMTGIYKIMSVLYKYKQYLSIELIEFFKQYYPIDKIYYFKKMQPFLGKHEILEYWNNNSSFNYHQFITSFKI